MFETPFLDLGGVLHFFIRTIL